MYAVGIIEVELNQQGGSFRFQGFTPIRFAMKECFASRLWS